MEERRDRDSKVEVERLGYEMYNGKHENRWAKIVMMYDMCSFFGYYKKRIHPKFPDFTHTFYIKLLNFYKKSELIFQNSENFVNSLFYLYFLFVLNHV